LTCEQNDKGGFTPKGQLSRSLSRDTSAGPSTLNSPLPSVKSTRPSSLRHLLKYADSISDAGTASPVTKDRRPRERLASASVKTGDDEDEPGTESDSTVEPVLRAKSTREAAKNVKPWAYLKRPKKAIQNSSAVGDTQTPEEEDLPDDFPRCATCAKALHERVWYSNRYFDHCQR